MGHHFCPILYLFFKLKERSFNMSNDDQINQLGQALFIINRHAKTALDPSSLYLLKQEALKKLLKENKAKKIGLQFSNNPRKSKQHSVVLVEIGEYLFHIPAKSEDKSNLKHLGYPDGSHHNPKPKLSLSKAKSILSNYLGWENARSSNNPNQHRQNTNSSLSSLPNSFLFYHKRKK